MPTLFDSRGRRRGRGFGSGLVVLLAVAGSRAELGPGPVGTAKEGYGAPERTMAGESVVVVNRGAAESLVRPGRPGDDAATLLFLGGRAATPTVGGGSLWEDVGGGRLVAFDRRGVVAAIRYTGGGGVASSAIPAGTPAMPAPLGPTATTRSVFDMTLTPEPSGAPLLWVERDGERRPVGRIDVPAQAMLSPVVNAGWVATTEEGTVYWASAMRPELRRYAPDGALEWTATWPRDGVEEPRFGAVDGTLTPVFRLVQQAVAVGPDGLVYVLATEGEAGPATRLLVFDGDGTLVRSGEVDPEGALYVGAGGHVYGLEAPAALARTRVGEARRAGFASFALPALDGDGAVRLREHRGKVVVVNFWASWCAPCRREMPLLDEMAGELDPDAVVVLGLNEDVDPSAGRAFLDELGGVRYPVAEGRGQLREDYGYRGLPYTVVLDPEGRVVRKLYGFGASIDPIRDAVREALAEGG